MMTSNAKPSVNLRSLRRFAVGAACGLAIAAGTASPAHAQGCASGGGTAGGVASGRMMGGGMAGTGGSLSGGNAMQMISQAQQMHQQAMMALAIRRQQIQTLMLQRQMLLRAWQQQRQQLAVRRRLANSEATQNVSYTAEEFAAMTPRQRRMALAAERRRIQQERRAAQRQKRLAGGQSVAAN